MSGERSRPWQVEMANTLIWRPLTFESDLPSFVYSVDKGDSWRGPASYPTKSDRPVSVRMETPVLYFYSEEETTVRVRVGFPERGNYRMVSSGSLAGERGH